MIEVKLAKSDVLEAIESGEQEFTVVVDEAVPLSEVVELCVALRKLIEIIDADYDQGYVHDIDAERALLAQWIDVPEKA